MELKAIARWAALGALFLIPLTPLLVVNSFFFPFISGKAFYFRIMVEVAVCAWAYLALVDVHYRPRFSWIGALVLAFVVWMFLADAFAVNAAKAFWSNYERMEGWVLLIHLLGLFVAGGAVLRVEEKWRSWFLWSVAVSVIVVIHCFLQLAGYAAIHQGANRIDASFGNSAYLAIYLLYSGFIAFWLALTERTSSWLKWSLVVLAVIEGILIFYTETRGTILGLAAGIALAAFLAAINWSGRARRYAVGILGALVLLAGLFFVIKDASFVRNNDVLNRIASISLSDGQTRFTLWHMAWEGVTASPKFAALGYGQEGFNYVFNQYYAPSLYAQEEWFDRAHNAFIDWLVAGGFPAFVLYVALFFAAIIALWKSPLARIEKIALTAALAGYAVHNLFVFDNLYSYVYFFAILALIDSQVARPIARLEGAPVLDESVHSIALGALGVLAILVIWFVNVPGMQDSTELISALSQQPTGAAGNLAIFEDLTSHPAFAAQEIREQLVSFASSVANMRQTDASTTQAVLIFAAKQAQLQIAAHPQDARSVLELSSVYSAGGDLADALAQVKRAEELSPGKEAIYLQEGAIRWDMQDFAGTKAAFDKAYALGAQFPQLSDYAAVGDLITGDRAGAKAILQKAYGTTTVDSDILALAYYRTGDFPDLISLWQLRANARGAGAQAAFGLAAAQYLAGEKQLAITTVEAAIAKYPDSAAQGQQLLAEIQKGQ